MVQTNIHAVHLYDSVLFFGINSVRSLIVTILYVKCLHDSMIVIRGGRFTLRCIET